MARIVQYTAPTEALTESTRGIAAWEQAGRRLGPLYNEQAKFQQEEGAIKAQELKNLTWPYDFVLMEQARAKDALTGGGSTHIRVTDPKSRGYAGSPYDATGQISRGAGTLGRALGDGGYALASATAEDKTLVGGELVPVSLAAKKMMEYNADLRKEGSNQLDNLVNTRDYWQKYNSGDPYRTDTSFYSNQGPDFPQYSTVPVPEAPTSDSGGNWLSGVTDWIGAAATAGMDNSGQF